MTENKIQSPNYRWIVLLLFMFINISIQMLWISFASVTIEAAEYYNVQQFDILLLSMIFMVVYIPVTFIASWTIDKYDFKIGAGIGALLSGIFGFLRFFTAGNYALVFAFQVGIAFAQPFILNSMTKLSANWFPEDERTTATGLSTLSQFIGIMLGLVVTPFLVLGFGFEAMNLVYGLLALISGVLFLIFAKNRSPTLIAVDESKQQMSTKEKLTMLLKNKYFLILLVAFFIGLGIFNMITTYIELIVVPKNPDFDATFAGIIGALMLFGGIAGCIVMAGLSDKYKKRKIFLIFAFGLSTLSLLIFALSSDAIVLMICAFLFGFGLLSSAPISLEWAVDLTEPVPESTSNGMLLMLGQIGGILFIVGLEGFKTSSGDYLPALILQTILLVIIFIMILFLEEK